MGGSKPKVPKEQLQAAAVARTQLSDRKSAQQRELDAMYAGLRGPRALLGGGGFAGYSPTGSQLS